MAKFVFINIPARSHVNPTLALVRELIERGEEVIYYLTEPFRELIESTGATFQSYESKIEQINETARKAGKPVGLPMYMLDESLFVIPQILEHVRAEKPDCIFYDTMALTGRLLAEILHVPAVNYRMIFMFTKQLSRIFETNASKDPAGIQAFQASMERVGTVYGIQPFTLGSIFTHEEDLNIVTIPRAFQIDSDAFGERFHFVGPFIGPRNEQIAFPFEQLANQQVIYITQGTVYNDRPDFYNMCFEAFADTPWKVVMSVGKNVDQGKLGPPPDNFIVRSFVPQLEVLKYTNICITLGGMTTIMEAFAEGIPLVVTPFAISDITVNARRVEELGLGVMVGAEALSTDALYQAVKRISSDPAYYARSIQMKEEIKKSGGYKKAADILQEYVKVSI